MRVYVSAGEPSGDLHGANLVQELRRLDPSAECVGMGGDRMAEAGCEILYPLSKLSVMGFAPVLMQAHRFLHLITWIDRYFHRERPDGVVLIDYPGLHWWIARRAHHHGIPVFYFVPPQLWGWAGWRVKKMKRWVNHVLCSLPFEVDWYRQRGVEAHYVGHPFYDELPFQKLDPLFQASEQARPGTIIGLLPGSRSQELTYNLPTLLRTARMVHAARPETRFLVACYKAEHLHRVHDALQRENLPMVEAHVGRTPEIIQLAHLCVSVSGSVSLELLQRAKPSVIVYRAAPIPLLLSRFLRTAKYITLVNLLADAELYPEFLSDRCQADEISRQVLAWLADPAGLQALRLRLEQLRERVARPGACERAARFVLEHLGQSIAKRPASAA